MESGEWKRGLGSLLRELAAKPTEGCVRSYECAVSQIFLDEIHRFERHPSTASGLPPLKGRQYTFQHSAERVFHTSKLNGTMKFTVPFFLRCFYFVIKGGNARFGLHLHSSLFTLHSQFFTLLSFCVVLSLYRFLVFIVRNSRHRNHSAAVLNLHHGNALARTGAYSD